MITVFLLQREMEKSLCWLRFFLLDYVIYITVGLQALIPCPFLFSSPSSYQPYSENRYVLSQMISSCPIPVFSLFPTYSSSHPCWFLYFPSILYRVCLFNYVVYNCIFIRNIFVKPLVFWWQLQKIFLLHKWAFSLLKRLFESEDESQRSSIWRFEIHIYFYWQGVVGIGNKAGSVYYMYSNDFRCKELPFDAFPRFISTYA